MKTYQDKNQSSGITAFEFGADCIKVEFRGNRIYEYQASAIGHIYLDRMKQLAESGNGLNAFINGNPEIRKSAFRLLDNLHGGL